MSRTHSTLAGLMVAGLAWALVGCHPRLVVRMTTVVYEDGSLTRRLEVTGRTPDGEAPRAGDWLTRKAGIRLADPYAWATVEDRAGSLLAEGFFLDAGALPATFSLSISDQEWRPTTAKTRIELDERVLVRRWVYSEEHGDPYRPEDAAAAIDAIIDLAVHALRYELHDYLGDTVDPAPAVALLRNEGRVLLAELLAGGRPAEGQAGAGERLGSWQATLARYGVPIVAIDSDEAREDFWDLQLPTLLAWSQARVAAALSTRDRPMAAKDLGFWPLGDDWEEAATELVERVWGGDDELYEKVEPLLGALVGYYGRDETPSFRFESRVRLPGIVLGTNGTQDQEGVTWLFRDADLDRREHILRAVSAEPLVDSLRRLGARREFSPASLLRLTDLLWERDVDGALADAVAIAVNEGDLSLLRDEARVPDAVERIAEELADLLDPDVPIPLPL